MLDTALNDQRKVIDEQRLEFMTADSVHDTVVAMHHLFVEDLVQRHLSERADQAESMIEALQADVATFLGMRLPIADWVKTAGLAENEIIARIIKAADERADIRSTSAAGDVDRIERALLLDTLDRAWREHLVNLEELRKAFATRSDPLNECKAEAFLLFEEMLSKVREHVTRQLLSAPKLLSAPTPRGSPPQTN